MSWRAGRVKLSDRGLHARLHGERRVEISFLRLDLRHLVLMFSQVDSGAIGLKFSYTLGGLILEVELH